ncbi:hypothetical protein [Pedobacter jamesrossensis]|uniref:YD repeat-containing protein n=1 Tax=Pedobacter jamesrossensis TaxID=1908238 RepID=A0ABV8NI51_9SPHI
MKKTKMRITSLIITLTTMSLSSCFQPDSANGQKLTNALIKSEKIIYYNIGILKNERSYGFGRDVFNEYDRNGNMLKESIILVEEDNKKETINLSSVSNYKDGKLSKVVNFSVIKGGVKKEELIFSYQKDGRLEKEECKAFEDGKEVLNKKCNYTTYTYAKNETANIFVFDEPTKTFKLFSRTIKEFDNRKNLIKSTDYDEKNEPYLFEIKTYNVKNLLVTDKRKSEFMDLYVTYLYNENGDVIKSTSKTAEVNYSYKYDDYGNWIEKTEKTTMKDGEIDNNYLIKRTIEYYSL